MDFVPAQIARLVLGYLKAEKCQTAFDAFFNTSPHFGYIANNKQRSKYVVTRVLGYSLKDILNEYSQIYNLIQERLEPTAYYEENSSKNIIDQLTYLLDNGYRTRQNTPQRSMSSTPIKDTNKKYLLQHNLSIIEENISSELNTTPLEALPGNSQEFNNNVSKRRCGIKTNKNTQVEQSDSGDSPDNCQEDAEDLEVLRQTLLEHTELHEKIAENINLVINTAESIINSTEENVCNELDSAIKAIVERTEADPIFEKLIGDLIGTTSENGEIDKKFSEEKVTESESLHSSGNEPQSSCNIKEISKNDSESIKYRLRSPKKQMPEKVEENKNGVSSEAKVVQTEDSHSVNKNIQTDYNPKPADITTADIHKNLTVNTDTGDVILYEGTLDNYVKTSTPPNVNPSNPILFNNNLLMVQPGLIQQPSVAAPILNTIQIDKPYYLLNNSQFINVSVPQYKVNNVTEQDILNMPTVIVCDDNQQVIPKRTVKSSCSNETRKIVPKQTPESTLREYLTLYQCGDDQDISVAAAKPKSQSKTRKKNPPKAQAIHIEVLKSDEAASELPILQDEKVAKTVTNEKPSSPRPTTPEANKQITRKTTPKSGSHIRALDFNFNTPSHKNVSAKKMKTSSKSPKKNSPSKSSTKISKSLFGTPLKTVKVENGENKTELKEENRTTIAKSMPSKEKKSGSWDSDLRALMGPINDTSLPKRKRKETSRKTTRKAKANMNATETDAKAIEENLRDMDLEVDPSNTEVQVKDEPLVEVPIKEENTKETVKEEIREEKMNKVENEDNQVSEFTVTLINCNAKSKFKKKCNIDNNISKAVKITKVKEIKSLELVPDGSNKLILSPSKLNANKRTLVENAEKEINLVVAESTDTITTSVQEANQQNPLVVCDKQDVIVVDTVDSKPSVKNENVETTNGCQENEKKDDRAEKDSAKFITPEMPKISNPYPVSANRNLTPMLETPLKYMDTPIKLGDLPKTPGLYTPNENSPMTKILNEQLQGIDLLSIETPKFPLTPSFPITPFDSKSSYPHRSTDYSTASSYYQPSDSEQNKSLEAILEEYKRLSNKNPSPEKSEKTESSVPVQNSISEKICNFNQNQIARKNLSLVREDLESSTSCESSSSEDETSSSSNNDTSSDDCTWNASANEAVPVKKPENPYMLRSRKKDENSGVKKTETIQHVVANTKIKTELDKNTAITAKESILREVEEKRKRTIAKFKEGEKLSSKKKDPKPAKIQPRRNSKKNTNSAGPTVTPRTKSSGNPVNKRKSKSPVKLPQKPPLIDAIVKEDERDVTLHISSDDDQIRPLDVVETQLLESSSQCSFSHPLNTFQKTLDSLKSNMKTKESTENISDQEAASLVEGLKERGIYLMPNKTPRKQEKPVRNFNNTEECDESKCSTIPVIETREKHKEIEENKLQTETKCKKEQVNKDVATKKDSKDSSSVNDFKLMELCIASVVKTETVEVKPPKENIQAKTDKEIKPDNNRKLSNSNPLKETDRKENNNNKKSTTPKPSKSIQRSSSEDKKNQNNKTVNTKIANGASNVVKCTEMTETKADLPSCNTEKTHKVDIKLVDASNMTLEEGEIISDDENTKDVGRAEDKKRKPAARTSSKTRSHEPKRKDIKSRRHSRRKSSDRDSGKKSSSRERANEKVPGKLKKEKEETIRGKHDRPNDYSDKVSDLKSLAVESQKINDPPTQKSNIEQDLNLTDSMIDEVFDDKFDYEETLKLVYDENKACTKSLKDYDLPISNKCFVVEVLGQQMEMSITPFESLLDIPERKLPDKVRILQNMLLSTGKKKTPLSILYGHLTKSPSSMKTISPLENLYDENSPKPFPYHTKIQKLKRNGRRRNSVDQKVFEFKPRTKRNTRSKSLDCSNSSQYLLDEDEECERIMENARKDGGLVRLSDENVIKDIPQPTPSTKTSPGEIDDELMNYAICGSERIENDSDDKTRVNKRKAKDEADDAPFKKTKREDLLKDINVDMFLTQLHGDN